MDIRNQYSSFRDRVQEFDDIYFIFLAVLLAFGALQTTGAVLNTDKPVVTVISPSMCPELQVGDILFVKGASYSNIHEGDIIVYNVPDRVEFTVGERKYVLEQNQSGTPSVVTSIGRFSLLGVDPARDRDNDRVRMSLNGTKLEPMFEGESYSISGHSVEITYATDLPPGDIPIVHRVVEKNHSYLETMGDANTGQLEFEKHVDPDQIHGKVFFEVPRVGLVKLWTMDLLGYSGDRPFVIDNTPSCHAS